MNTFTDTSYTKLNNDIPPSDNKDLILRLKKDHILSDTEFTRLLTTMTKEDEELLYSLSREVREDIYGKDVYVRGLIEFTNYCRNDCIYCGIRSSNKECDRYRLTFDQIMECADTGESLGFRTFVLQGGEDMYYSDDDICEIVRTIKNHHPDCAITLSIGERSRESYQKYFDAGADRYLLRHETITPAHYNILHTPSQSIEERVRCLYDLQEIGFQTGCGIMIGSPGQTIDHIINDLNFMYDFKPHMIGMGPFIPHTNTPFNNCPPGRLEDTLHLIAIVRLMLPRTLIPATTALGTLVPTGRELGLLAGANVVMPNLSPCGVRAKYTLYDGKICTGEEAAECVACLRRRIESTGYTMAVARGDYKNEF